MLVKEKSSSSNHCHTCKNIECYDYSPNLSVDFTLQLDDMTIFFLVHVELAFTRPYTFAFYSDKVQNVFIFYLKKKQGSICCRVVVLSAVMLTWILLLIL
jgi:hypothetical protein